MNAGETACAPTLTDGVVTLRAHDPASDVERMVEQCRDDLTRRFVPLPSPYGPADAAIFIDRARTAWTQQERSEAPRSWAIEVSGLFAGSIDYRPDAAGGASLGYGLHPDARGHGVTERAARLALDHAFGTDRLTWMRWAAVAGNVASRRVAWRVGFHDVSARRGELNHGGELVDSWHAVLNRDDPRRPQVPWYIPPRIEAGAVVLRPWRTDDTVPAERDEMAARYLGDLVPEAAGLPAWLLQVTTDMADGRDLQWCIADPATDQPLGSIHVFGMRTSPRRPGGRVGYWLLPAARGRGLLGEVLPSVVDHAFRPVDSGGMGLHRLGADADVTNTASIAALRRAGFTEVGVKHADVRYADRRYADMVEFELMAPWTAGDVRAERQDTSNTDG